MADIKPELLEKMSLRMADVLRERLTQNHQEFILGCAYEVLSSFDLEPDSDWDEDYLDIVQKLACTIHIISQYDDGSLQTEDA